MLGSCGNFGCVVDASHFIVALFFKEGILGWFGAVITLGVSFYVGLGLL